MAVYRKSGILMAYGLIRASLVAQMVKNLPAMWETGFDSWFGKILWRRREWLPTPVFLPGESPWTEEPSGLNPWGHKELDMTEAT